MVIGKIIILIFFLLSVVIFALIKFAAKGVKAGYEHVQRMDGNAASVVQRPLLASSGSQEPLGSLASPQVVSDRREAHGRSERQQELLSRFEQRRVQHGQSPISVAERAADAKVCGLTAGLFAKLVNGKQLILPPAYSDNDRAVAWIAMIATDVATQMTGADFELSGLVISIPLFDMDGIDGIKARRAGEQVASFALEAADMHNRIVMLGMADDAAGYIAKSFMDWAMDGSDAGVFAVRRMLPKIAEIVRQAPRAS